MAGCERDNIAPRHSIFDNSCAWLFDALCDQEVINGHGCRKAHGHSHLHHPPIRPRNRTELIFPDADLIYNHPPDHHVSHIEASTQNMTLTRKRRLQSWSSSRNRPLQLAIYSSVHTRRSWVRSKSTGMQCRRVTRTRSRRAS